MVLASTDAFSSGSGQPTDRGLRAFVACVIGVTFVRFFCAIGKTGRAWELTWRIRVSNIEGIAVLPLLPVWVKPHW